MIRARAPAPSSTAQDRPARRRAALCLPVRGAKELLAFSGASAAALWEFLTGRCFGSRIEGGSEPPLKDRLAPFPVDD